MPKFSGFRLIVKGTPIKLKRIREGFKSPQPFKTILQSDFYQEEDEVFFKNGVQTIFPITGFYEPRLSEDCTSLEYCFATGWSMTIRFVRSMCQLHKVSAYLGFSESGYGFSGRLNFDTEGVFYDADFFAGLPGLYFIDRYTYFEDVWYQCQFMEEAYENKLSKEQFVEQYAFFMNLKDKEKVGLEYEKFVNEENSSNKK